MMQMDKVLNGVLAPYCVETLREFPEVPFQTNRIVFISEANYKQVRMFSQKLIGYIEWNFVVGELM